MSVAERPDPQNFDPDDTIGDLMGRVVEDARELAEAEVNYIKVKVKSEARPYKEAAIWFGIAAVFAIAALVAFAVGITLALATLIGPLGGGVVATVLLLGAAGLFATVGKKKLEGRS
ncbi:phage holin family protein [Sphingomicrobium aestuariivivum]|uniref:phage holin family protein n=1 Tax=Sphingomicrobium aestuariivivum TaxID=1582356 RepID=UPI001FD679B0|nr:phage holin family protein [Sphingomicrobium aestuariivivum]MCJ8189912.1 phage holin family protein [Sphingomicrobium aestuariivivum]